jgi:uncharacterized protein YdbL (DUF1318 family)
MKHPEFPSKIKDKVIELLNAAPRELTYAKIANDTGLSEQWIGQLAKRKIIHASSVRLEALYNYLSPVKLEV